MEQQNHQFICLYWSPYCSWLNIFLPWTKLFRQKAFNYSNLSCSQAYSQCHNTSYRTQSYQPPYYRAMATFKATIDNVGDYTIARNSTSWCVSSRGSPISNDDIVARWLVCLRGHPKPYGCLERYGGVCDYKIWIVYEISSNGFTCLPIIVVADKSSWTIKVRVKVFDKQSYKCHLT